MPSQGIFPTQGLNPGLLHHRQILHQLNSQGSPLSAPIPIRHIPTVESIFFSQKDTPPAYPDWILVLPLTVFQSSARHIICDSILMKCNFLYMKSNFCGVFFWSERRKNPGTHKLKEYNFKCII